MASQSQSQTTTLRFLGLPLFQVVQSVKALEENDPENLSVSNTGSDTERALPFGFLIEEEFEEDEEWDGEE